MKKLLTFRPTTGRDLEARSVAFFSEVSNDFEPELLSFSICSFISKVHSYKFGWQPVPIVTENESHLL